MPARGCRVGQCDASLVWLDIGGRNRGVPDGKTIRRVRRRLVSGLVLVCRAVVRTQPGAPRAARRWSDALRRRALVIFRGVASFRPISRTCSRASSSLSASPSASRRVGLLGREPADCATGQAPPSRRYRKTATRAVPHLLTTNSISRGERRAVESAVQSVSCVLIVELAEGLTVLEPDEPHAIVSREGSTLRHRGRRRPDG
jgi:hypothetical protein